MTSVSVIRKMKTMAKKRSVMCRHPLQHHLLPVSGIEGCGERPPGTSLLHPAAPAQAQSLPMAQAA